MQKAEKHITSTPWITLAILSSLGIIAVSAETMVLPAIPDFIVDLDISYEASSWILAALLVTGAVMTPIAGKLSDIYGKKKVLLIILAIYILGLLLGSMSTNFLSLVTARVLQGVGISMIPIAFSIIRDKFSPEKIAIVLFGIIAKFVYVKKVGQQQAVSNKGAEFCCRFIHVRPDILLSENTNSYANVSYDSIDSKQKLSKNIDIR